MATDAAERRRIADLLLHRLSQSVNEQPYPDVDCELHARMVESALAEWGETLEQRIVELQQEVVHGHDFAQKYLQAEQRLVELTPKCHKCGEPESAHGDFGFRDHQFVGDYEAGQEFGWQAGEQQRASQDAEIVRLREALVALQDYACSGGHNKPEHERVMAQVNAVLEGAPGR